MGIETADPLGSPPFFKRADKPSSVIRLPEWMVIYLGHGLPNASSSQPERDHEAGHLIRSYLALLQMGFTMPCLSPNTRWALTPPFHPCPQCFSTPVGGLFSVALSVGFPRLGVTQHFALWSSDFPHLMKARPSGPLIVLVPDLV